MALRELMAGIAGRYRTATTEPFKDNAVAQELRNDLPAAIEAALGADLGSLVVKGSAGQGQWTDAPWAAVFDPTVTTSAMRGYYPVYLFDPDSGAIHLSLNQGTTAVREEFKGLAREVLVKRAGLMRERVVDFAARLGVERIALADTRLAQDYVAGHAAGATYNLSSLPDEDALVSDLREMVRCYRALVFRGGLDFGVNEGASDETSVDEQRKYRMHKRIERNRKAAPLAKAHHGCVCQVCQFDFGAKYGALGDGFIEVHHLVPMASLTEGAKVRYDIVKDFAVLCANCHRMIHRMPDPSDLVGLRALLVC